MKVPWKQAEVKVIRTEIDIKKSQLRRKKGEKTIH